ncbi:MAG: DMT family transporter [Armatimonadetes bacterium]|nr:DMT family transporter [Armatimonadota bacterium]
MTAGPQTACCRRDAGATLQPDMPRRGPAIAAMFLSAVLFGAMTVTTKMLSDPQWTRPLPTAEITLARFGFGALAMLPLLFVRSANLLGGDRRGLVWRGLMGGLAVYAYFLAIRHTTLSKAVLLNMTSVIFAPMFAWLLLRERVRRAALVGIGFAVVGILLVTRPQPGALLVGDAYGLLSGILAGVALTAVRRLRRNETASAVFFYFSLVGIPVSALAMVGSPIVWPDPAGWRLLLLMSGASIGAQVLMTYGYRYVTTSEGVLITLSQIAYAAAAGALLFGEPIAALTVVGAAFILTAGIAATRAPSPQCA